MNSHRLLPTKLVSKKLEKKGDHKPDWPSIGKNGNLLISVAGFLRRGRGSGGGGGGGSGFEERDRQRVFLIYLGFFGYLIKLMAFVLFCCKIWVIS